MTRELTSQDFGLLLRGVPSGSQVLAWTEPSENTPTLDTSYVLPPWAMDVFKWYQLHSESAENLWISGPTGCGKTALVRWLAASLNVELFEITGNSRLEFPDLVGQWVLQGDKGMQWSDGPLTAAMRRGAWLVINEVDLLDPGTLAGLNTVLDGGCLTIPEHSSEVVRPAQGFAIVATANTNGAGDETGMYAATLRQNIALMDRFSVVMADYIPAAVEEMVLSTAASSLPEPTRKLMVRVANDVRALFRDGQLDVTMSVRTSLRWARLAVAYAKSKRGSSPLSLALDIALCNRASVASAQTIREILQRYTAEETGA